MRLPWPFRRRPAVQRAAAGGAQRTEQATSATLVGRPSEPPAWPHVASLRATVDAPPLTAPTAPFHHDLAGSHVPDPILMPLGHDRTADGPAGLVMGLASPTRVSVSRDTMASGTGHAGLGLRRPRVLAPMPTATSDLPGVDHLGADAAFTAESLPPSLPRPAPVALSRLAERPGSSLVTAPPISPVLGRDGGPASATVREDATMQPPMMPGTASVPGSLAPTRIIQRTLAGTRRVRLGPPIPAQREAALPPEAAEERKPGSTAPANATPATTAPGIDPTTGTPRHRGSDAGRAPGVPTVSRSASDLAPTLGPVQAPLLRRGPRLAEASTLGRRGGEHLEERGPLDLALASPVQRQAEVIAPAAPVGTARDAATGSAQSASAAEQVAHGSAATDHAPTMAALSASAAAQTAPGPAPSGATRAEGVHGMQHAATIQRSGAAPDPAPTREPGPSFAGRARAAVAPLLGWRALLAPQPRTGSVARSHSTGSSGASAPSSAVRPSAGARPVTVSRDAVPIDRSDTTSATAHRLGARAFTDGASIGIPEDAGSLESGRGRGLVAHELAHVDQRARLGTSMPTPGSDGAHQLEQEARQVESWSLWNDLRLAPSAVPAAPPDAPAAVDVAAAFGTSLPSAGGARTASLRSATLATAPGPAAPLGHVQAAGGDTPPPAAPPSDSGGGAGAGAAMGEREVEELMRRLWPKVRHQLAGEFLVSRERAGLLTDLR